MDIEKHATNFLTHETKVAVASRSFSKNQSLRERLQSLYKNSYFNDTGKTLVGQDLIGFVGSSEVLVSGLEAISKDFLSQLPHLKLIAKYGVGLDSIDLDAMREKKIKLGWTPGVNKRSVAELALGFMLTLIHRAHESSFSLRSGLWQPFSGRILTGKTIGIVGCGNVGKELILLLAPFRCRILVYDVRNYSEFYRQNDCQAVEFEELLQKSDIISLHLPLTENTKSLFNETNLKQVKKNAIIINTARGGIVDEHALEKLICEKHILAAGFDVFKTEPPESFSFINNEHVFCTSHIGGSTVEAIEAMGLAAIESIARAKYVDEYEELYCSASSASASTLDTTLDHIR